MEFTFTQLIALLGIPSIISGVFMLAIQKSANRREKKRDEQEKARCEHQLLMMKSINASITLGMATAKAVGRIPDANCNGDMHKALEEAEQAQKESNDFLNRKVSAYVSR